MRQTKTINPNTKKGQEILRAVERNEGDRLSAVYGRCSERKEKAWVSEWEYYDLLDGYDFHICSHNSNVFTLGYWYIDDDMREVAVYVTPTYRYEVYTGYRAEHR